MTKINRYMAGIISLATERNLTGYAALFRRIANRIFSVVSKFRIFYNVIGLVALTCLAANAPATSRFSQPFAFAPATSPRPGQATLLGAVQLAVVAPDGASLHGLSGLAWDHDESTLYAVSDFGYLVWLRPIIEGGRLTAVEFLQRFPLRDSNGAPLSRPMHDAEGLTARRTDNRRAGDTELAISFEQKPRVVRYSPTGKPLGQQQLPARLADDIQQADPNRGLESITWDRRHGYLYGPETNLGDRSPGRLAVIAGSGKAWDFPAALEGSSLVGLTHGADDEIITLERRYVSPWQALVITVRALDLESNPIEIRELAQFSSTTGWAVDNFEGITRHTPGHYFLVSDDNANPFQKTLLIYLAINPKR